MKLYRVLIGAVAVAGLLAFASPASAQWHGRGGPGFHGRPGFGFHGRPGFGGPRVRFAIGFPFYGWGYPYGYPAYGYGYYACPPPYYTYRQPRVYEGRVVTHRDRDAKDTPSYDK